MSWSDISHNRNSVLCVAKLTVSLSPQLNPPSHIVLQCPYLKKIGKVSGISMFMNLSMLQALSAEAEAADERFLTVPDD